MTRILAALRRELFFVGLVWASVVLVVSLICGCTNSRDLGNGITVKTSAHLFEPSVTVVLHNGNVVGYGFDHSLLMVAAPAAITGGSFVAGLNTAGSNLKPDQTNVNGGSSSASGGDARSAGGAGGTGLGGQGGKGGSAQTDSHINASPSAGASATDNSITTNGGASIAQQGLRNARGCR